MLTSKPSSKIVICLDMGVREAESVTSALLPDNIRVPEGLCIRVFRKGSKIYLEIDSLRGLNTLLATVEDAMSCIQIAASSINVLQGIGSAKTI